MKSTPIKSTPWCLLAWLCLFVAGLSSLSAEGNGLAKECDGCLKWNNPMIPQRADPHVFLHTDGYYYLAATVPDYSCIEIRRATSIAGLSEAEPTTIWAKHESGPMAGPIWAPEIHFIDGNWYVYFSSGESGKTWGSIRLFSIRTNAANPLEGEWIENGRIETCWDSFSLDPTTFEYAGERYFLWTQAEPDVKGTNIMIARMISPTQLDEQQVIISRPEYPWEQQVYWVDEAPAVLIRNSKIFITFSASATDHNYCMGLLTADQGSDLLDPASWKKCAEPVFKSCEKTSQYGPGHNSFTTTPDGKTDILVYHSRNYKKIAGDSLANPDRAVRAQVIGWHEDGSPDFGVPVADGPYRFDLSTDSCCAKSECKHP